MFVEEISNFEELISIIFPFFFLIVLFWTRLIRLQRKTLATPNCAQKQFSAVYRMLGDQWARLTTEWCPDTVRRRRGRPRTRRRDDLIIFYIDRTTLTQERNELKNWKAFAQ